MYFEPRAEQNIQKPRLNYCLEDGGRILATSAAKLA